jgi:sec-independent protein translocase protein TatA
MFGVGSTEFLILCLIALLLFGDRLPTVMRSLGSSVSQFKRGLAEVEREIKRSVDKSSRS